MRRFAFFAGLCLLLGCSGQGARSEGEVARAGEKVLHRNDLDGLIQKGTSKEDSIRITKAFIDRWALQQLLMQSAEMNLTDEEKAGFDELVEKYKSDLYVQAYLKELIREKTDTVVTDEELKAFYEANPDNFKATQRYYKLRFVKLPLKSGSVSGVRSRLNRWNDKDRAQTVKEALGYSGVSLNDSTWTSREALTGLLPLQELENKLYPGRFVEHRDSVFVYLIKIREAVPAGTTSPFSLAKEEIKEAVIAGRKHALIDTMEKDILNNASKDKLYEVFK